VFTLLPAHTDLLTCDVSYAHWHDILHIDPDIVTIFRRPWIRVYSTTGRLHPHTVCVIHCMYVISSPSLIFNKQIKTKPFSQNFSLCDWMTAKILYCLTFVSFHCSVCLVSCLCYCTVFHFMLHYVTSIHLIITTKFYQPQFYNKYEQSRIN